MNSTDRHIGIVMSVAEHIDLSTALAATMVEVAEIDGLDDRVELARRYLRFQACSRPSFCESVLVTMTADEWRSVHVALATRTGDDFARIREAHSSDEDATRVKETVDRFCQRIRDAVYTAVHGA